MSLKNDPIFQDYDKLLTERENEMAQRLIEGKVKDFETYKLFVGRLEGIQVARELLGMAIKNYTQDED